MKRIICWWSGHDYIIGKVRRLEAALRNSGPYQEAVVCLRCGNYSLSNPSDPKEEV